MSDAQPAKIVIEDADGQRTVMAMVLDAEGALLIGRDASCGLRLNERNVSRQHAKIVSAGSGWAVHDLGAYNGVTVNGTRIEGEHPVAFGDLIRIGDYQLELRLASTMGSEITKPRLLIGNDEHTEPEGEERALARRMAEEPTTPSGEPKEAPAAAPVALDDERTDVAPQDAPGAPSKGTPLPPPHAHLLCVLGGEPGRAYPVDRTPMVIGRTQDNDIGIEHRSMSRHHAKVTCAQNRYHIVDLDSANGLLVNDEAYSETELRFGDVAELGHVRLRFVGPNEPAVLTAEERESGHAARAPQVAKAPTPAPSKAPYVAMALLGACIVGSYLYLARAPQVTGVQAPAPLRQAISTPPDAERMLSEARQASVLGQYAKAESLASAVLALDGNRTEARTIIAQCDAEVKGHNALEAAVGAAGREDWDVALNALKDVPKTSSSASRAATLLEQVRPAVIRGHLEGAKRALESNRLEDAQREVTALEAVQGGAAALPGLQQALGEAKRSRSGSAQDKESSASGGRHSSATSSASSGHKSGGSSSTEEARDAYAEGAKALQAGKHQVAIDALTRCINQNITFSRCYRALGIVYAKMGNGPKAVKYYRQYLKVEPNAKDAASVKQLIDQYESSSEAAESHEGPSR